MVELVGRTGGRAELEVAPALLERRQEEPEVAQRRGGDVEGAGAAAGERVAAVEAAAERGPARADRALGDQGAGRRALHRGLDLELRQLVPVVAQEQGRPGAARQHGGATGDPAVLGDDARDLAGREVERAHRAALVDAGAERGGGPGQRRDRERGLGAGIARREQARP